MRVLRVRNVGHTGLLRPVLAMLGLCLGLSTAQAIETIGSKPIQLQTDRARIMKIEKPAGTIVIGNPAIADAAIQNGTMLVLTGKSYGVTNLIILDPRGDEVANTLIEVQAPSDGMVTVHRGAARSTYACTPVCERALVLGDAPETFDFVNGQINTRNGLAQGAATSGN
jgi:Flp pilus assembly secretin CpaC